MDTQRLFTRVELKQVDASQRLITGYASATGNVDRTKDIIDKGAFDRTLKENTDVVAFIGHDSSKLPVGEPVSIKADEYGLLTITSIYNTPDGDALLEVARRRLERGRTLGMSIGYKTIREKWVGNIRHLQDVDLIEYSFLASPDFAANPLATVTGVKGRKATGVGQVITTEDSYEDLQDDLEDAAALVLGASSVCVCATFPNHVIVSTWSYATDADGEMIYYDFPYTLNADGEPELGDPTEVDPAFVPSDAKARADIRIKAKWSASFINDLPDSAFALILPGGSKDSDGKTTPRSLRKLPHHGDSGAVDEPHLRNALSRAPQMTGVSDSQRASAEAHLARHASAAGIGDTGKSNNTLLEGKRMPREPHYMPWDAAFVSALPDDAFAFIEGDGVAVKDDTGRTVPRTLRHYPHHNEDGSVDEAHLKHALEHASTSGESWSPSVVAHLERHARAASQEIDAHAPEWAEGAAADLLSIGYRLDRIISDIAEDRKSMERLGIDTKKGARLNSSMRARLKDLHSSLGQILDWADQVEKGDDGKARVDMFRHRLAMLQLEEVSL